MTAKAPVVSPVASRTRSQRLARRALAAAALVALAGAAPGPLQAQHPPHGGHAAPAPPRAPAAEAASTRAFREANARMHRAMDIAFTGDADIDFARAMIPHHQGAIEMARILLAHGRDPELRRLAEAIIATQAAEIEQLRAILRRLGG